MKIDLAFFANSVILLAIIIALTAFKVVSCKPFKEDGEEFSWKRLLIGLCGNLVVLVVLSFVYFVGANFGADLAVIQIGEATYTIQAMLNALIILAIGVYGLKLYRNAIDYFGLGKEAKTAKMASDVDLYQVPDYNTSSETQVNPKG